MYLRDSSVEINLLKYFKIKSMYLIAVGFYLMSVVRSIFVLLAIYTLACTVTHSKHVSSDSVFVLCSQ